MDDKLKGKTPQSVLKRCWAKWAIKTASMCFGIDSTSIQICTGDMNTIVLKDIPSVSVLSFQNLCSIGCEVWRPDHIFNIIFILKIMKMKP